MKQVREKLVARGPKSLSDSELLSVLLGDTELAHELLPSGTSLAELAAMELPRLRQAAGSMARAANLATAFELGRRAAAAQSENQEVISGDVDVIRLFQPRLAALPHEEFWALCLSSAGRIIDRIRISQGGTTATVVDPKLIVKRAVERLAPAIIVVHNHPSGLAQPSSDDIALTERLAAAAALFDIALLDHVIITPGPCFSFRKHQLIK